MKKSSSKSKGGSAIAKINIQKVLSEEQFEALLRTLQTRFENNIDRHNGIEWADVKAKLEANAEKLSSLQAMESTGGEPDIVGYDTGTGEYIFYDCSAQSPAGRRSICYDRAGEQERIKKGINPAGNALDLAAEMGIELLTEAQYRALQELGDFDTTTSSWIETPAAIRDLGGALFCDRRYDHVFVYHNGAQSFYSARGFRGALRV